MPKQTHSQPTDSDPALFDRLADGELSAAERRELLAQLDEMPGGWRQCALAFLEAQTLRQELGTFASEALTTEVLTPESQQLAEPVSTTQRNNTFSPIWYAVAASALIAFGLGTLVRTADDSPQNQLATTESTSIEPAAPQLANAVAEKPTNNDETLTLWVADGQGGRRSLQAPLVDADTVKREFGEEVFVGQLAETPSRVSPTLRRRLEGRGFRLNTRRRFAPLFLEGGQPLVVPVEDVQIVPVGGTEL